jgi:NADH:ubiquinone oxidoreductase subunit E
MSRIETPADLSKFREQILARRNAKETWLAVCAGTGCRAYGAEALAESLEKEIGQRGLSDKLGVRRTGCHGFCERGPLVVIQPSDVCYVGAQEKNIPAIIDKLTDGNGAVDKLLYQDEESGK